MKKTKTEGLSTEAVVTEYVDIVNAAIDANSDGWPVGKLIKLGDDALEGKKFGMAVYKDDPDTAHDHYALQFSDGRVNVVAHGQREVDFTWKVSEKYLRKVIANRQKYVEKPAKLDFDWLKSRAGLAID